MMARVRYMIDYDPDPDLSYLEQDMFEDIDPDDVTSYLVELQRECPCCHQWQTVDSLGGVDYAHPRGQWYLLDDEPGTGVAEVKEVPHWIREHFDEQAAAADT